MEPRVADSSKSPPYAVAFLGHAILCDSADAALDMAWLIARERELADGVNLLPGRNVMGGSFSGADITVLIRDFGVPLIMQIVRRHQQENDGTTPADAEIQAQLPADVAHYEAIGQAFLEQTRS